MNFEFTTVPRILFGEGRLKEVRAIVPELGKRALVVCGSSVRAVERVQPLFAALTNVGVPYTAFATHREPTIDEVRAATKQAQAEQCDLVIGFGGGSALDTGKAVAALLTNGGDPLDYIEVIGKGQPLSKPSAPYIAIPTTAGTGSEVTRNAVLGSPEHRVKVSLRSPYMLPRVALVDPELTYNLPPNVTAATGLDALTQLIEAYVSVRANPMTDAICREGMHRVVRSLRRAFEEGDSLPWRENWQAIVTAREDMCVAGMLSGMALANAALGAAHGLSGPLGGMFDAPHGALCAAVLPYVVEVNERAAKQRLVGSPVVSRFQQVRRAMGDLGELVQALRIPPLRDYGVMRENFPEIIEKAKASNSMKGNPVVLDDDELREILERAL
jgi:alcohol dehydrogenase class IV